MAVIDTRVFDGVTVEIASGDITNQVGFDVVVNAANAQLRSGGGVAGAIHRAAGPGLYEECQPLAPIRPGDCVITGGHALTNPWVLHCLGPVYGVDEPADGLLASCYRRALEIADERELRAVAFPALSTGAFGYPMAAAAEVALATVAEVATSLEHVRRVRFVLVGDEAVEAHQDALLRFASR